MRRNLNKKKLCPSLDAQTRVPLFEKIERNLQIVGIFLEILD
jgi:hypothetical protein